MRPLLAKIKPATGFSKAIYVTLNILLPLLVFIFVRMHFVQLALAVIILSKWRMFVVRPRFWVALVRANAVDIIVGVSMLALIAQADSQMVQLILTGIYAIWLVFFKPASSTLMISLQALIGMSIGLIAVFSPPNPLWSWLPFDPLVPVVGLICYLSARHFFDSFDEVYARLLSYVWAFFAAGLTWVLGHWLLFYRGAAQPVVLLLAVGFGLATLYYLDHHDRLSVMVRRQIIFVMVAIAGIMITSLILSANNKII